jgi:hypothetical protein
VKTFATIALSLLFSFPPFSHSYAMENMKLKSTASDEKKTWEEIDKEYQEYIIQAAKQYKLSTVYGISRWPVSAEDLIASCVETADKVENVESFRKQSLYYNKMTRHQELPPGSYAMPDTCPVWIENEGTIDVPYGQGLKIHVSAKPETALKIAKAVLPILEENKISYKIIYDLPLMRGLYYLTQYENSSNLIGGSKSTQAGKFIVLYPKNLEQAKELIQKLEQSFKKNNFTKDDFVKVEGDAEIGDAGGIFARYGHIQHHQSRDWRYLIPLNPEEEPISEEMMRQAGYLSYNSTIGVPDERFYPWPDYMNHRKLFNKPLFGDLKAEWINPNNPEQVITWDNRPNCWAELDHKSCF